MAKGNRKHGAGFSLVELLIAVVFIGVLMAGMANVFRSSVTTLSTSSEGISSARRNRMSIDLLYDDLNSAGMYLADLASPPQLSATNPAFYVLPNMAVAGAAADDPQKADQVLFYLDQPLPFQGTLSFAGAGGTAARSASELANLGTSPVTGDTTYTIDCKNASYASLVKAGHSVVIKDAWEAFYIQGTPSITGTSSVTITSGASPNLGTTGLGATGAPPKTKHIAGGTGVGSDVVFYIPAQMVRYSLQMKLYDPQKATGIPCLVRAQTNYNPAGIDWTTVPDTIVAENVSGFKVYLSADSGQTWAGYGKTYTGFATGWSAGMRPDLDTQLVLAGRPDFKTTQGNENWIRSIPTLVRLDITTRTAVKRAEYSATPLTTTDYKDFTQSLVIVPRHFGLTMN